MSCSCCGSILVSYMRGGRFEPFYCNDEYFCHWIQWQHLGKTPAVVHGTKFSLKNLLFNTSWISIRLLNQWWLVVSSIPTGGIFIFYWNLLKPLNAYLYINVKSVLFAKTSIDSMNAGKSSQLGKNGFGSLHNPTGACYCYEHVLLRHILRVTNEVD